MTNNTWPNDASFALFLSHDIDQIHDRELFHFLATVNHIRRLLTQGEPGNVKLAVKRLARMLFAPKQPIQDFETILTLEAKHGFRSTFFVLHDVAASKNGPRYRLVDPALQRIADMIQTAKGEIGLHGGVKCLNQTERYRQCRKDLESALSIKVTGIRNHLLRHEGGATWAAQSTAGFSYDATFGDSDELGPKDGQMFPFFACDAPSPTTDSPTHRLTDNRPTGPPPLLVLPLTVMDCTLFRSLKLSGKAALDAAWDAIVPVIEAGGLVSLLWHNNYFNEPEYADWQWVYEQLLERLAEKNPWCATGAEIAEWWSR
ncbi:MAG: hypothetical protein HN700_13905 [Verrucomicrobia bacterium]|jgi:hypothetical protein|nr:hypothetical protein [Verrucomicrobiota bacterium]